MSSSSSAFVTLGPVRSSVAESLIKLDLAATWASGAPEPFVLAGEHRLRVLFDAEVGQAQGVIAVLRVDGQVAVTFGFPHEDCSNGHRLATLGFEMESAFEVVNSTWIDDLKRMEAGGWQPNSAWLANQRHYIFSFRDRVLEFVAPTFQFELSDEPFNVVFERITEELLA